jgi:hypothetical protein
MYRPVFVNPQSDYFYTPAILSKQLYCTVYLPNLIVFLCWISGAIRMTYNSNANRIVFLD